MLNFVKGFGIVNKAEINAFLELSCFFHDPTDVGSLISGSSAFSIGDLLCAQPSSENVRRNGSFGLRWGASKGK